MRDISRTQRLCLALTIAALAGCCIKPIARAAMVSARKTSSRTGAKPMPTATIRRRR